MPITPEQIAMAAAVQHAAARDTSKTVRLVAGPGTGKSASIEERVCWLLRNGVDAEHIHAVSFTRASANDLKLRCYAAAAKEGFVNASDVRISTLHSMALRLMKMANMLNAYPASPLVLDNWEIENIFDDEYGYKNKPVTKRRRESIRRWHEAFWSTGQWGPPNFIPPDPPISEVESNSFAVYHRPRTQTYSCVLPGEIVGLCVEQMKAGLLDAVEMLKIKHLIVDEFQDLNPLDQQFIDFIIKQGAVVFVAGDDDQSLYSFRFASPSGIQLFPKTYPGTGTHNLKHCFRCPPQIMDASTVLIAANASPDRIPKEHISLYSTSNPVVQGCFHRWKFSSGTTEARAVAASCKTLIESGVSPREIMILLSNQKALGKPIIDALDGFGVEAEHPREESFLDSKPGRLALAMLRIVCDSNDYISHRALLGLRSKVGVGTCSQVCDSVIAANMNFRSVFYDTIPDGVFSGLSLTAVKKARATCGIIREWKAEDTLEDREPHIRSLISEHLGEPAATSWLRYVDQIPPAITLEELRDFLWADTDEQQSTVLRAVMERLGIPVPDEGPLPPRVRVMTMHGAKGLSARVVFIPGLEETIFPGPKKSPYPGLVLEAARMLYVSITRARAACIASLASTRMVNGNWEQQTPSRFAKHLNGAFTSRVDSLTQPEVEKIMEHCANL